MNKSYVAHKEYVRGIVREIYPAANLDEDFFPDPAAYIAAEL